jgi:D-alanyl-lipoteichoic acid acyltransferase DltB (MBOAT superfamily)
MRPGRIFLFLLAVVLTLFILSLATGDRKLWGDKSLFKVPSDTSLQQSSLADTVSVQAALPEPVSPEAVLPDTTQPEMITRDTLPAPALKDSVSRATVTPFFPGDAIRDSLAAGKQVRIMFYGDSQIEGDRLTSLLRKQLRESGGGTGPGLISPVTPVMYTRSYVVKSSANWVRYTLLDYRSGVLPHNRLGPMLAVCRFKPPQDTLNTPVYASVKINPVPGADESVSKYENLRIFYGNNPDTVFVSVRSGSKLLDFTMLETGAGPLEYSTSLPSLSDIIIEFTGRSSPDIYALSLESSDGVIVDNIPVRGSAGLEFVMTDTAGLEGCFAKLHPDMIFHQFGLNVVRNVRSEYHYYEEGLVKQVDYLRKVTGGVPVVLVSLTDMALKSEDTIIPYTNIPAIRDAQKKAAGRSGVIFWDAWASMGGKGSIVKWFNHVPPLASKDLTHLSNAGADTIALRIYSDLLIAKTMAVSTPPDTLSAAAGTVGLPDPETAESAVADTVLTVEKPETKSRTSVLSFLKYNPQKTFIFTTPAFWTFLLVVMAGFALIRKKRAMCHTWLLLVSLYFYYKAGGLFFILLLFSCVTTYLTALYTSRAKGRPMKRFWLIINIIVSLGLLSYFKYAGFFTESINSFLGTSFRSYDFFSAWSNNMFGTGFDVSQIILPIGISFFTFQALSYNIDVYRGKIEPVKSFIDYSFYHTFFPQLIAGPIVRASEFVPQMKGEYTISRNEFGHGLFLILQGLIKKVIISDFISVGFIDRVFDTPALYSGFENLMSVYGYGLQIYCDFSGYTDIAIGVAMLMGFRLPLNFNSPYKASNISDFWKRWHITLSRWLKDYLYVPLGGNRHGAVRTGINLMITMLIGGLWHGAATRFVLWGGLHGIALVIDKIWQWMFRGVKRKSRIAQLAGIIITFNFVSFAWIFFRAGSMEDAGVMLSQIFSSFSPGNYRVVLMAYLPVLILIASGYILHFLPVTVKEAYRGLFIRMPLVIKFLIAIGVAILLNKVGTEVLQPFIYFRF